MSSLHSKQKAQMEGEEEQTSLFPLFPATTTAAAADPQWLCNTSFTAAIQPPSVAAPDVLRPTSPEEDDDAVEFGEGGGPSAKLPSYDLVPSFSSSSDGEGGERRERWRRKKKRRRKERGEGLGEDKSRKSGIRAWAGSETKPEKDYYVDVRGDRDNLAFGSLYRMDVARYTHHTPMELSGTRLQASYMLKSRESFLEVDGDALESKLRSGGRYWSAQYSTLERHKGFKHVKVVGKMSSTCPGEFISVEIEDSCNMLVGKDDDEESWEDEVIQKTREFNKMSREFPHNEKVWTAFADFQDKIASTQPQKAARLQTLEKKISILEKAVELNPESEDLLLYLLKSYEQRDSSEVLLGKWEKVLMQHFGSYKLWKEFLLVGKGDFSRFKVSDMRRRYAHAILALSSACNRLCRQACLATKSQPCDPALIELELGLVDIFLSLCRFEWQSGFQELSTGLFQAEIEYCLFCPSLDLSLQSKQRLFEHFWNGNAARVGEDGAIGWSAWIEEEESRNNNVREDSVQEMDVGGWSGWFDPTKNVETNEEPEKTDKDSVDDGIVEEGLDIEDGRQEDDIEVLLKKLGINVGAEPHNEVKDTITWTRWSKEELLRDSKQWMPVREISEGEETEQLSRTILFEDVRDYLFSLHSEEARFCLVSRFIDFFGGKISPWTCTNSSSWDDNNLNLHVVPGFVLEFMQDASELVTGGRTSPNNISLEALLDGSTHNERTNMNKFLRNSLLLLLNVFPRNYILEEALLLAEELSVSQLNSSTGSIPPSQALAKHLLKNDRQDLLLSGLYARRVAAHGNFDRARKIFDMTLSLIDDLPLDLRENRTLLYLWYAEMEVEKSSSDKPSPHAIHILSCLGSGEKYSAYNGQLSSLHILKAHNGFKEQVKCLGSAWARGCITDKSVALVCSASLFEILTTGWTTAAEVIEEAFSMTLPEQRRQNLLLESLCVYFLNLLQLHIKEIKLSKVWSKILHYLHTYPFNPRILSSVIGVGTLYTVPQKIRRVLDEFSQRKPSIIILLFALSYELGRSCSQHRIRRLFEKALANDKLQRSVILWHSYLAFEVHFTSSHSAAKRVFFRAIHACPWSKRLWLDGFQKLNSILTASELSDLHEVMREKELNLRTDIYEILLQDEFDT